MAGYVDGGSGGGGANGVTIITDETLAQLQSGVASRTVGDLGFPTDDDCFYELRCAVDGEWEFYFQEQECFLPPTSGWAAYNSGSVSVVGGARVLAIPAATFTTTGYLGEQRVWPTDPTVTPYFCEFGIVSSWLGGGSPASTGTNTAGQTDGAVAGGISFLREGANELVYGRHANPFTGFATDAIISSHVNYPVTFIRIEEDGTNRRVFLRQPNGRYEPLGGNVGRTLTFTSAKVWWGGTGHDVDAARDVMLVSYREGAL